MEQIRIIKEMREHDRLNGQSSENLHPRYMIWENVCFSEDTLVTCSEGYKKISDVAVGEKVKTLSGKYCPVVKTYKFRNKEVVKLRITGGEDIIVTPNHPFWVRKKTHTKSNQRIFLEPEWKPAEELTKEYMVAHVLDIPTLPDDFITPIEAWTIGRYLADGSLDTTKSNPRIFISCGLKKADGTYEMLKKLPYNVYENHPHATAINYCFTSREFYSLIKDCGRGAANKKIAPYIFELPIELQKQVLYGYLSGDGYIRQRGQGQEITASTASRELAYGIARIIRNVYHVAASINVEMPHNVAINGRTLNVNHPSYSIYASFTNKVTTSYYENGIMWQPVKEVIPLEDKITVYNLSVMEDNTYAANDIMGHNCGAFSSNKGEDFRCVLEETAKIVDENAVIPEFRGASGHLQDVSWETDGVSLGEYMMHNTGVYRNDEKEYAYWLISTETPQDVYYLNCGEKPMTIVSTKLSQVLEKNPDPKYNLSARACLGILTRANRRGKKLPELLEIALTQQAGLTPSKSEGGLK